MPLRNGYFGLHRTMRRQPLLVSAIVVSLIVVFLAGLSWLGLHNAVSDAMAQQVHLRGPAEHLPAPIVEPAITRVSLQPFNSVQMVQALTEVASQIGIPLNEVSFSLDEAKGQPFLRYRASFNVIGEYLAVRRFIDGVHAGLLDASLDSISCTRPAFNSPTLQCAMVFSTFYRRSENG